MFFLNCFFKIYNSVFLDFWLIRQVKWCPAASCDPSAWNTWGKKINWYYHTVTERRDPAFGSVGFFFHVLTELLTPASVKWHSPSVLLFIFCVQSLFICKKQIMSSGLSRGRSSSGQTQPQVTLLKMLCLNDYIHSRTIGSELGSDIWLDMSGPDALNPSEQFVSTWTEAQTVWKNLKKPGLTLVCPGYGTRSKTAAVAELLSTFHKDIFPFIQIRLHWF